MISLKDSYHYAITMLSSNETIKIITMKKTIYLPDADAGRHTWLINFNNKLVDTYAAELRLNTAQMLYIMNGLKMFTYIVTFWHYVSCTSICTSPFVIGILSILSE